MRSSNVFIMNWYSGIGEVLWDLLPSGKALGGAPANFAYYISHLSTPKLLTESFIASSVGDDELGHEIMKCLAAQHVSTKYISVSKSHPTSTVGVKLDGNGNAKYGMHGSIYFKFIAKYLV